MANEAEAVIWLGANREVVYGERTAPAVLFLQEGGAGQQVLQEVMEEGVWGPPESE